MVVEFGLGNYGSGGLLEPLQVSGIYKTTSGLGFTQEQFQVSVYSASTTLQYFSNCHKEGSAFFVSIMFWPQISVYARTSA